MTLDRYIPLRKAAKLIHVSEPDLYHLIELGKIKAAMITTSAEVLLRESDVRAQLPREEQPEYKRFARLQGIGIGIREGGRKYDISSQTLSEWVKKGYIKIISLGPNKKIFIDEADVAYCSEIYHANPGQGKRVFMQGGIPYQKK